MMKSGNLVLLALLGTTSGMAAVAQFDINDFATASPTLSGWTAVTGGSDNADTLTGSDGTHTLTLTTPGDGQDRDRGSNGAFWRDFWFVADSHVGGQTATAAITGLVPNTSYQVEIWAYDLPSTGNREAVWTDTVTGNSTTLAFNGSTSPAPISLDDGKATVLANSDGAGVLTLTGAGAPGGGGPGLPNVFVTGIRISTGAASLPVVEAESGTLGSEFSAGMLDGATHITIASTSTSTTVPGSASRVASYSVAFPEADTYQLYARVLVGPNGFDDDSFFHGNGFGAKSPTSNPDWVFTNGLAAGGFTAASDAVTTGGGSAGIQIWKWIKFSTLFTVPEGSLTQTFQVGGREDGFFMDKFVFGPVGTTLTVAELDSGSIAPPPDLVTFDGPDGIAIHRFGQPSLGATGDGANPASSVVLIDGGLQGTTLNGGLQGNGAVFRVGLDGSEFESLKSFGEGSDVAHPQGGLLDSGDGFFGVSQAGGANGSGTIFRHEADGSITILRSFSTVAPHTGVNSGGASPSSALAVAGNTLYGAAAAGGSSGNGTLFWIADNGVNFTVLKEFSRLDSTFGTNLDGARPRGGLVHAGGKLYGTTTAGGTGGSGVVFSMDVSGGNYAVLHHFPPLDVQTAANSDGAVPTGGIIVSNGTIHGTTLVGGTGGKGTVFSIGTDGGNFKVLHHFPSTDPMDGTNSDGASPAAGIALAGNVLYGTTSAGGDGGSGTVFALDPSVPDFRRFHSFEAVAADSTNRYGAIPVAPLLRVGNALYGTTTSGGPGGTGTVFRIPIPLTAEVSAATNPDGTVNATLLGRGAPFSSYAIRATDDFSGEWQNLGLQAADASGFIPYIENDLETPLRFYQLRTAP